MSVKVKRRENESVDQLLRRFRVACDREGIPTEIKEREYYEKPSEIKRKQQQQVRAKYARKRMIKAYKMHSKKFLI